jgi:hypothetical protein
VARSYEAVSEILNSTKGGEYIGQLNEHQLLKNFHEADGDVTDICLALLFVFTCICTLHTDITLSKVRQYDKGEAIPVTGRCGQ